MTSITSENLVPNPQVSSLLLCNTTFDEDGNIEYLVDEDPDFISCVAKQPILECVFAGMLNHISMNQIYRKREELGLTQSGRNYYATTE
jgi:hypothetical protein